MVCWWSRLRCPFVQDSPIPVDDDPSDDPEDPDDGPQGSIVGYIGAAAAAAVLLLVAAAGFLWRRKRQAAGRSLLHEAKDLPEEVVNLDAVVADAAEGTAAPHTVGYATAATSSSNGSTRRVKTPRTCNILDYPASFASSVAAAVEDQDIG